MRLTWDSNYYVRLIMIKHFIFLEHWKSSLDSSRKFQILSFWWSKFPSSNERMPDTSRHLKSLSIGEREGLLCCQIHLGDLIFLTSSPAQQGSLGLMGQVGEIESLYSVRESRCSRRGKTNGRSTSSFQRRKAEDPFDAGTDRDQ